MPNSKLVCYLIDTNTLRALVEKNPFTLAHYRRVFSDRILIPVIVYTEEVKGWVNPPGNDEKKADTCYKMLMRYLAVMGNHRVLPYSDEAKTVVSSLPANIGVRDKRIAACAIAIGYTVVTTNDKDFKYLLPEDRYVDWTKDPNLDT